MARRIRRRCNARRASSCQVGRRPRHAPRGPQRRSGGQRSHRPRTWCVTSLVFFRMKLTLQAFSATVHSSARPPPESVGATQLRQPSQSVSATCSTSASGKIIQLQRVPSYSPATYRPYLEFRARRDSLSSSVFRNIGPASLVRSPKCRNRPRLHKESSWGARPYYSPSMRSRAPSAASRGPSQRSRTRSARSTSRSCGHSRLERHFGASPSPLWTT